MYLTSKPRLRIIEILIVPLCALYVHDVPGWHICCCRTIERALKKNITLNHFAFQKLGSVPIVSHNRDKNPRGTELLNV
jgi:hypothetical protein